MNCKMSKKQILALRITGIICLVALIGGIIFVCTFDEYNGVRVGMTREEYESLIPEERRIRLNGHEFYKNTFGDSVIVRFDRSNLDVIVDLRCYPSPGLVTKSDMESIEEDMSIDGIVKRIGIPVWIPQTGIGYITFETTFEVRYYGQYYEEYDSDSPWVELFILSKLQKAPDDKPYISGKP